MQEYHLKISAKTRILNLFRLVFKIKPVEYFLIESLKRTISNTLYDKIVPPNYLYSKHTIRTVKRNEIIYELDLSDVVDHAIFFGLRDVSRTKLLSLLKKGMFVLDIGANMGDTALNFSRLIGENGSVIAFEPDAVNFDRATKNIQLNHTKNITINNIGLGNENTTLKLYRVNSGNQGMNRILTDVTGIPYTEVEIKKLDDYVIDNKINRIDLIKIDVEGFEMNVLHGGTQTLKKFTPILFIEVDDNNLKDQKSSVSLLIKFLNDFNYNVYHSETNIKLNYSDDFSNCHYDIYAIQN